MAQVRRGRSLITIRAFFLEQNNQYHSATMNLLDIQSSNSCQQPKKVTQLPPGNQDQRLSQERGQIAIHGLKSFVGIQEPAFVTKILKHWLFRIRKLIRNNFLSFLLWIVSKLIELVENFLSIMLVLELGNARLVCCIEAAIQGLTELS